VLGIIFFKRQYLEPQRVDARQILGGALALVRAVE